MHPSFPNPEFNLFGSRRGASTAADLSINVKEMSMSSLVAEPTTQSFICHDLYTTGASKTDKCVLLCMTMSKLCLCSRSAYIYLSPHLISPPTPPRSWKDTPRNELKVYTLTSSKNPVPDSRPHSSCSPHRPDSSRCSCWWRHRRELEGSQSSGGTALTETQQSAVNKAISSTWRRAAWSAKTDFKLHGEIEGSE